MQEDKPWYKKWWGIVMISLLFLVISLVFASFLYVTSLVQNVQENEFNQFIINNQDSEKTKLIEGDIENNWTGPSNPKVTIVEFGDYACPFCKKSHSKIREISLKYKDNVKVIFRDFPFTTEYSMDLALGARCAGEQGLFWVMHDKLFINQGAIATEEDIYEMAKQSGVEEERFSSCFESKKYLSSIQKDIDDALELEVAATPTWFINGHVIKGDIPYEFFIELIENIISLK